MQTLAARGLAERHQAKVGKPVADLAGAVDHPLERHVRGWIKIEDQPPGLLGQERLVVPGVQFKGADLGGGHQRLHPVALEVGFAIAPDLDLGDQGRLSLARMALEELLLSLDAVGHADHRAGPATDMLKHPFADRLVVARQVQLGHWGVVAGIRPQGLAGVGKGLAQDDGRSARAHQGRLDVGGGARRLGLLSLGLGKLCRGRRGLDGFDLGGGLVFAQALERGLAELAVACEAFVLDLGHQLWRHPVNLPQAPCPAGPLLALERRSLDLQGLQAR